MKSKKRSDALEHKQSTCKICNSSFFLERGKNGDWKRVKTCSTLCRKEMYRRNAKNSMHSQESMKKSWETRRKMELHKHLMTPEAMLKSAKASKANGALRIGAARTGEARLNQPRKSRLIIFTTPMGVKYEGASVLSFVREHKHLFNLEDLNMVRKGDKTKSNANGNLTCRAMRGLSSVVAGARNSWKEWTCSVYDDI